MSTVARIACPPVLSQEYDISEEKAHRKFHGWKQTHVIPIPIFYFWPWFVELGVEGSSR